MDRAPAEAVFWIGVDAMGVGYLAEARRLELEEHA
jgi:hypothetical protein